jgi:hypothetical protein
MFHIVLTTKGIIMKALSEKQVLESLNSDFGNIFRMRGKNAFGDRTKYAFNVTIDSVAKRYNVVDKADGATYKHKFDVCIETLLINELKEKGYKVEYMNILTWVHGYLCYKITK